MVESVRTRVVILHDDVVVKVEVNLLLFGLIVVFYDVVGRDRYQIDEFFVDCCFASCLHW